MLYVVMIKVLSVHRKPFSQSQRAKKKKKKLFLQCRRFGPNQQAFNSTHGVFKLFKLAGLAHKVNQLNETIASLSFENKLVLNTNVIYFTDYYNVVFYPRNTLPAS